MNNWTKKIKRKSLGSAPTEASSNIPVSESVSLSSLSRLEELEQELVKLRDKRITGRTKQLGLKVRAEFLKRLKELAVEEECFLVEILERSLECYEKHRKNRNIF